DASLPCLPYRRLPRGRVAARFLFRCSSSSSGSCLPPRRTLCKQRSAVARRLLPRGDVSQARLFSARVPDGLVYHGDFLTPSEEASFLLRIRGLPFEHLEMHG